MKSIASEYPDGTRSRLKISNGSGSFLYSSSHESTGRKFWVFRAKDKKKENNNSAKNPITLMIGTHSYKCNTPSCSDCSGRPLLDPWWTPDRRPVSTDEAGLEAGRTGRKSRNSVVTPRWKRKRPTFSPASFFFSFSTLTKFKQFEKKKFFVFLSNHFLVPRAETPSLREKN